MLAMPSPTNAGETRTMASKDPEGMAPQDARCCHPETFHIIRQRSMRPDIRRFPFLLMLTAALAIAPGLAQALTRTHHYNFSVLDDAQRPVAHARVYTIAASGYDQAGGECITGQDGRCGITFTSFSPVNAGIVAAVAGGCDGYAESGVLSVKSSFFVNEDRLDTSLTLSRSLPVQLSVKDELGLPLADARAQILSPAHSELDLRSGLAPVCNTNAQGSCSVCVNYAKLGPNVWADVSKDGYLTAEAAGGQSYALAVTLYRQVRTLAPVTVLDSKGKPVAGATIDLQVFPGGPELRCLTNVNGICPGKVQFALTEPNFRMTVKARAPGMHDATAYFVEQLSQPKKTFDVTMMREDDYLCRGLTTPALTALGKQVLPSVELLRSIVAQKEATFDYGSICLSTFKNKKYLSLPVLQPLEPGRQRYSNTQLGSIVFDELVRKILDVTKSYGKLPVDGYDISVETQVADRSDNYRNVTAKVYRFYLPKQAVEKYKDKDITSQQLIDASVVLLNDDRIELKLQ